MNTREEARISESSYDVGLRKYMLSVYNYMAVALIVTAIVAMLSSLSETMMYVIHTTPVKWIVIFAPLIMVFIMLPNLMNYSASTAYFMFLGFSALMGLSLSYIFLVYTDSSIARIFFITASMFGATSIYGYTTKKDLSKYSSVFMMALIGLVIASIVNMFLQSSTTQWFLSVASVLLFAGLTIYDTQRIKEVYRMVPEQYQSHAAIYGALGLYLNFINMFRSLLYLFGDRR